ncbi:hypothetical protein Slala02_61860 [Streptomyces lavendulae subsp. lavendulae]|nr:hypothetical protein Slala01_22490 [Streptomyces lavendulae subsp. lavendulae]GLX30366.1 hypothetical protein Slala02_61860 [Streptomyces lavendulae subsp. lavendulae]
MVPTSALVRVDLPALGRPTKQAKPARCGAVGSGERSLIRAILPDATPRADQTAPEGPPPHPRHAPEAAPAPATVTRRAAPRRGARGSFSLAGV